MLRQITDQKQLLMTLLFCVIAAGIAYGYISGDVNPHKPIYSGEDPNHDCSPAANWKCYDHPVLPDLRAVLADPVFNANSLDPERFQRISDAQNTPTLPGANDKIWSVMQEYSSINAFNKNNNKVLLMHTGPGVGSFFSVYDLVANTRLDLIQGGQ